MPDDSRRFAAFTDAELAVLWDGLTVDDGIRYGVETPDLADPEDLASFAPDYVLVCDLHAEAELRGLDDADPQRWQNVL